MRRRFNRPLRRFSGADIPPLLIHANQSISAGNFVEAAGDFEQLARAAEARGGPRAPMIHIQGGRMRMMAGQPDLAMQDLERGFGLLAARGRLRRLGRVGNRIIAEFRQRGYSTESQKLADYLESLSPGSGAVQASAPPARHASLPTHCSGCGAPVHPDEVEWLDDVTAECAFCGSPLRSERSE